MSVQSLIQYVCAKMLIIKLATKNPAPHPMLSFTYNNQNPAPAQIMIREKATDTEKSSLNIL